MVFLLNVSRRECDVYHSLLLILSGTGVEFTQTCAVMSCKNLVKSSVSLVRVKYSTVIRVSI